MRVKVKVYIFFLLTMIVSSCGSVTWMDNSNAVTERNGSRVLYDNGDVRMSLSIQSTDFIATNSSPVLLADLNDGALEAYNRLTEFTGTAYLLEKRYRKWSGHVGRYIRKYCRNDSVAFMIPGVAVVCVGSPLDEVPDTAPDIVFSAPVCYRRYEGQDVPKDKNVFRSIHKSASGSMLVVCDRIHTSDESRMLTVLYPVSAGRRNIQQYVQTVDGQIQYDNDYKGGRGERTDRYLSWQQMYFLDKMSLSVLRSQYE